MSIENQEGELYRLTFADSGVIEDSYRYFSQDLGSQTEESDIIQISELSDVLSKLCFENDNLHRNMNLIRSTLQTEFHRRLTIASDQLYSRMNQRLDEVEQLQKDRVEVVRRAFKTQLTDSLTHMASLYNEKLRNKLINTRTFTESEESMKNEKRISDLTLRLKKSEAKIKELMEEIREYENDNTEQIIIMESQSDASKRLDSGEEDVIEQSKEKDNIQELYNKIQELTTSNESNKKTIETLNFKIKNMSNDLSLQKQVSENLILEKEILTKNIEKLRIENNQDVKLGSINKLLDLSNSTSVTDVKKPISAIFDIQKNCAEYPDMTKEILRMKETIKYLQLKELEGKKEITKLNKSLRDENRNYLEEIQILQSINGKLKEDMFKRIEMQKQFQKLHKASIVYANNSQPIGVLPSTTIHKNDSKSRDKDNIISTFKELADTTETDNDLLRKFVELVI